VVDPAGGALGSGVAATFDGSLASQLARSRPTQDNLDSVIWDGTDGEPGWLTGIG
jgi:hypothetical protein